MNYSARMSFWKGVFRSCGSSFLWLIPSLSAAICDMCLYMCLLQIMKSLLLVFISSHGNKALHRNFLHSFDILVFTKIFLQNLCRKIYLITLYSTFCKNLRWSEIFGCQNTSFWKLSYIAVWQIYIEVLSHKISIISCKMYK